MDQDHDTSLLMPLYIGLAPRDPRGQRPVSDEAIDFIEPVTVDELADVLLDLGIPSQVIDGAQVGAPGWVMARGLGWSDGYFIRSARNENSSRGPYLTMGSDDLAAHLAEELNVSCRIGPAMHQEPSPDNDQIADLSVHKRAGAVIGNYRSTDGPMLAHGVGDPLWFTYQRGQTIVSGVHPDTDLSSVVQYPTGSAIVGLERNGPWRRLMIVDDGILEAIHEWGPDWLTVDPRDPLEIEDGWLTTFSGSMPGLDPADLVQEYFEVPQAFAADFLSGFDLDSEQLTALDKVLADRSAFDPFTDVLRILGLPDVAAEVAEGWRDGHDLPGATRVEPQPFGRALWDSVTTVPQEPGLPAWIQRMWITRPASYYWLTVGEVTVLAAGTVAAMKKNRKRLATGLGFLIALSVADLLVPAKWRGQDR